jgi:hypothetical protein
VTALSVIRKNKPRMLNSRLCVIDELNFTVDSYDRIQRYIICSNIRSLDLLPKEKGSFDVGCGERVAKHFGQPFTVECRQHYGRAAFKPVSLNVTQGHFLYNDHRPSYGELA